MLLRSSITRHILQFYFKSLT